MSTAGPAGKTDAVDESAPEARSISEATLACADVVRISAGPLVDIATRVPGAPVPGIAIDDDNVEVRVVITYGRPLADVADDIDAALAELIGARTLTVRIDDIVLPGEDTDNDNDDTADTDEGNDS